MSLQNIRTRISYLNILCSFVILFIFFGLVYSFKKAPFIFKHYSKFYSEYHSVQELLDRMQYTIGSKCPHGNSQEILRTYNGYPVNLFRVGNTFPKDPRRILITAGMHGRERSTSLIACFLIETLCRKNSEISEIPPLGEVEVLVIPIVNPDGQEKARLVKPSQRKNLRPSTEIEYPCENNGVDLNRNFPTFWGEGNGTSSDPCSDVYSGPFPLSEPESKSIAEVIKNNKGIMAHIDIHSFGQIILRGSASKRLNLKEKSTQTIRKQHNLARSVRMAIRKAQGTDMVDVDAFQATARLTNRTQGGTLMDYMLYLQIPSISLEIGPRMTEENRLYGYATARNCLLETVREIYEGLKVSILSASSSQNLPVYSDDEIGLVFP